MAALRGCCACTASGPWRGGGFARPPPTAAICCRSRPICWSRISGRQRRTASGLATSPASRQARGWLYLAAGLDLATRKIVGWAMRDHVRAGRALSALLMAVQWQRPEPGLVGHPERGSQQVAGIYRQHLTAIGARASMGRRGCSYDNAPTECFVHTLKAELVHQRQWATREEARRDLFAYIETYYSRARIQSAIGYMPPEHAERPAGQTPCPENGARSGCARSVSSGALISSSAFSSVRRHAGFLRRSTRTWAVRGGNRGLASSAPHSTVPPGSDGRSARDGD